MGTYFGINMSDYGDTNSLMDDSLFDNPLLKNKYFTGAPIARTPRTVDTLGNPIEPTQKANPYDLNDYDMGIPTPKQLGYNPTTYEQINEYENALRQRGVTPPPASHRSVINRVFDALGVLYYPIMGALNGITDNKPSTGFWNGAWEGLKGANPFSSEEYKKGQHTFSDILDNFGWKKEANPQGKWYDPTTWSANNIAHGVVGFAGDVLLDPLTYLTGGLEGVARGTGATLARNSAKELARGAFDKGMESLSKGGAKDILEKLGQKADQEAVDSLLSHIDRTAGYIPKDNSLKWFGKTLIDDSKIRAFGDATVAPYINTALDKIGNTGAGQALSKMFTSPWARMSKDLAQNDPEQYAKLRTFMDYTYDINKKFEEQQNVWKNKATAMFDGLSDETRNTMSDLMEQKGMFQNIVKTFTANPRITLTPEAQGLLDRLNNARNDIQQTVDNYQKVGKYENRINDLKQTQDVIDGILKAQSYAYDDIMKESGINLFDNLRDTDRYKLMNQFRNLDTANIQDTLQKQFGMNANDAEQNAYKIRATIDNATRDMYPAERPHWEGQSIKDTVTNAEGMPFTDSMPDKTKYTYMYNQELNKVLPQEKQLTVNLIEKEKGVKATTITDSNGETIYRFKDATGKTYDVPDKTITNMALQKIQPYLDSVMQQRNPELYNQVKNADKVEKAKYFQKDIQNTLNQMDAEKQSKYFKRPSGFSQQLTGDDLNQIQNELNRESQVKSAIAEQKQLEPELLNQADVKDYEQSLVNNNSIDDMLHEKLGRGDNKLPYAGQQSDMDIKLASAMQDLNKLEVNISKSVRPNGRSLEEIMRSQIPSVAKQYGLNPDELMKEYRYSKLNTEPFIDSQKPIGWKQDTPQSQYFKGQLNPDINPSQSGELAAHDTFNYKGVNIDQPVGAPQDVKMHMLQPAIDKIAQINPKLATYLGQIDVRLANADSAFESVINMDRVHPIKDEAGNIVDWVGKRENSILMPNNQTPDLANRVSERLLPHEIGHAFGKDVSDLLYKNGEKLSDWANAMSKDGNRIFKDAQFITNKEGGQKSRLVREDFAESFSRFVNDPYKFSKEFPERYKAMNQALKDFQVPALKDEEGNIIKNQYGVPDFETLPTPAKEKINNVIEANQKAKDQLVKDLAEGGISEGEAVNKLEYLNKATEDAGDSPLFKQIFGQEFAPGTPIKHQVHDVIKQMSKTLSPEGLVRMRQVIPQEEWGKAAKVLDFMRNEYVRMAEEEGLHLTPEQLDTYMFHGKSSMLNRAEQDKVESALGQYVPGENVFEKDRTIQGTIKEINDRFRKQFGLKDNFFETDAAKLFIYRGLKSRQLVFEKRFTNDLFETLGLKLNDVQDLPLGHNAYAHADDVRQVLSKFGYDNTKMEEVLQQLKLPKDFMSNGSADYFTPVVKLDADTYARLKAMDKDLKAYALNDATGEFLRKAGKLQYNNEKNALLGLYDKFMQLWKVNATMVNPGFHGGNFISNQFQSWLAVGSKVADPRLQVAGYKMITSPDEEFLSKTLKTETGKEYTYKQLHDAMLQYGVVDNTRTSEAFADIVSPITNPIDKLTRSLAGNLVNGQPAEEGLKAKIGNMIDKTKSFNPLSNKFIPYRVGGQVGQMVEGQSRAALFMAAVQSGQDLRQAAETVNKYLFDYRDLSPFEEQVMKRIIPFYSWMRKNVPLQLEQIINQPGKFSMYKKAQDELDRAVGNKDLVPDEYKNTFAQDWWQLPFTAGKGTNKMPLFLNPRLPVGDLNKLSPSDIISSMTPALKVPIELAMNKDIYFGSQINKGPGDTDNAPGYLQALMGGTKDNPAQISPEARYILRNITSLESLGKLMDNTDAGTTGGTGKDKNLAALAYLTGIKANTYDYEKYKKYAAKQRLSELKKKLQSTYQP